MKKAICLIVLILTLNSSNAQKYFIIDTVQLSCHYLYEFQQDSTSLYSMRSQEMILQIGKHCSKFVNRNTHFSDSLIMVYEGEDPTVVVTKVWSMVQGSGTVHSYCSNYVYKRYPNKDDLFLTAYFGGTNYKSKDATRFKWEILSDSIRTIAGYKCNMAKTTFAGRNYVAWFTMEVPVSDGPYKFTGLPGLIVSVNDTPQQHKFELLSISKGLVCEPILLYNKNYIDVSPQEFAKALNIRNSYLFNKISSDDGIETSSDEVKVRALHNLKSRNNYIEKYDEK